MLVNGQSLNKQSVSYKGGFKNSELLAVAMSKASDYDLYQFGNNLSRMSKIKDGRMFELDWRCFSNPFKDRKDIVLISSQNSEKFTSTLVGREFADRKSSFTGKAFDGVISKINEILENIYPYQETTRAKRENSLNRINNLVIKG